jgi:hypothetical protein
MTAIVILSGGSFVVLSAGTSSLSDWAVLLGTASFFALTLRLTRNPAYPGFIFFL